MGVSKQKGPKVRPEKVVTLNNFWRGVEENFKIKVEAIKEMLRHQASGAAIEEYFRELLRSYLPRRYIVEPGFVVNDQGKMSDYIDILIVDALNIPPLCNDPPVKIFAAESIVAAIEITAAPLVKTSRAKLGKIPKLQDDLLKLARVRKMSETREYYDSFSTVDANGKIRVALKKIKRKLAPRTFLITCGSEGTKNKYEETLVAALEAADKIQEQTWVNMVYSLNHGLFRFIPYTKYEYRHTQDDVLLEFILRLNHMISTYQAYRIDITRYRPSLLENVDEFKQV